MTPESHVCTRRQLPKPPCTGGVCILSYVCLYTDRQATPSFHIRRPPKPRLAKGSVHTVQIDLANILGSSFGLPIVFRILSSAFVDCTSNETNLTLDAFRSKQAIEKILAVLFVLPSLWRKATLSVTCQFPKSTETSPSRCTQVWDTTPLEGTSGCVQITLHQELTETQRLRQPHHRASHTRSITQKSKARRRNKLKMTRFPSNHTNQDHHPLPPPSPLPPP